MGKVITGMPNKFESTPITDGDIFVISYPSLADEIADTVDIELLSRAERTSNGSQTLDLVLQMGRRKGDFDKIFSYQHRDGLSYSFPGAGGSPGSDVPKGNSVLMLLKKLSNDALGESYEISIDNQNFWTTEIYSAPRTITDIAFYTRSDRQDTTNQLYDGTVATFFGPLARPEADLYFREQIGPLAASKIDIAAREKALTDRQKEIDDKEKALGDRQKVIDDKETALAEKEKTVYANIQAVTKKKEVVDDLETRLKLREMALEEKEKNGSDRPPDYESAKILATKVWPSVIKQVLGEQVHADLVKKHQELMKDWVQNRRDKPSSDAYDYLVYSYGPAWRKVLRQNTSAADFSKVQAKYLEIESFVE